jgi:nucleoside-diphosphate-sugar epimerase
MRIFLTGATGYVGSAVLDALIKAGHQVTGLARDTRKAKKLERRGAAPVVGQLGQPETWIASAQKHDGYIHTALDKAPRTAASDRAAIEAIIGAAQQDGGHVPVLFTSMLWVIGPTVQPADETTPLNPAAISAWRVPHEQLVLNASGIRPIVVRPGLVFGGDRGYFGDLFKDGTNGLVRVIGEGRNRRPAVYDRDLADLYTRLVTRSDTSGVYHATDESDESVLDVVEALSRNTTHKPDVRFVPLDEARAKMGTLADALALDQVVRSPRAHSIGWTPALKSIAGNIPRLLEEWRRGKSGD